jgi:hypothetical protein
MNKNNMLIYFAWSKRIQLSKLRKLGEKEIDKRELSYLSFVEPSTPCSLHMKLHAL